MSKSRGINRPRTILTAEHIEQVRLRYPHEPSAKIAQEIGLRQDQIYKLAGKLGIKKTAEFMASANSGRLTKDDSRGISGRFQKGLIPANKGLRRPGYAAGNMAETQFKKGQKSHTWKPIGSERISKEGYLQVKLRDSGVTRHDYVPVHQLVWELHRGAIPDGHRIAFKDGDKTHTIIENLEAVSVADMMRRNTIHQLPPELKEVLQLKGALNRRITCHERHKRTQKTSV